MKHKPHLAKHQTYSSSEMQWVFWFVFFISRSSTRHALMCFLRLTHGIGQNVVFWELAKILTVFIRYFVTPALGDRYSTLQIFFFRESFYKTLWQTAANMVQDERRILLAQAEFSRKRVNSVYRIAQVFWLVKKLTHCITANILILIIPFRSLPSLWQEWHN